MEKRLSLVTLGVRDLAASRAFYERLGWKESMASNAEVAFFKCGGLVFALWSRDALADDAGVQAGGGGFANISLAHNVRREDEVDATLREAEKAGARILKPAAETSWGVARGISRTPMASHGRSPGTPASRYYRTVESSCPARPKSVSIIKCYQ
jgi:catechol 2,3-dioxygenase-like lactoylglutathione lyase family enzyme